MNEKYSSVEEHIEENYEKNVKNDVKIDGRLKELFDKLKNDIQSC